MCDVTSELTSALSNEMTTDRLPDRKIIDTIPDNRPPQVTFSCSNDGPSSNYTQGQGWSHPLVSPFAADGGPDEMDEKANGQCMFQFWVDRVESFYCQLDGCKWDLSESYSEDDLAVVITQNSPGQARTRPTTIARRSIALAFPVGSSAERMAASVSRAVSPHPSLTLTRQTSTSSSNKRSRDLAAFPVPVGGAASSPNPL